MFRGPCREACFLCRGSGAETAGTPNDREGAQARIGRRVQGRPGPGEVGYDKPATRGSEAPRTGFPRWEPTQRA